MANGVIIIKIIGYAEKLQYAKYTIAQAQVTHMPSRLPKTCASWGLAPVGVSPAIAFAILNI
ncbi:MAG: hypothetical protein JNM57_02685 [Cyclobacteriaceae bacterium]|nr:hypothetical protein [Cyclobacteriaceae bacterium]